MESTNTNIKPFIHLREASKDDAPIILELICELADYERAPEQVTLTEAELLNDGFGERPLFKVILAETGGKTVGMALWYFAYSTWKGKVLYLEDIIIKKNFRGMGIGSLLFEELILQAGKHRAKRMQWQVLNWNEKAIRFYQKYGANMSSEWLNGSLTEEQILNLKDKIQPFHHDINEGRSFETFK